MPNYFRNIISTQKCGIAPIVEKLALNHGHIENAGEDSDPILQVSPNNIWGVLGAFDGMGGAGSSKRTLRDGTVHTDAYLASRFVRSVVKTFVHMNGRPDLDNEEMTKYIKGNLSRYKDYIGIVPSRLKSSTVKTLPTTMAMMTWENTGDKIKVNNYWAGDSRNYILTPNGMYQMTVDHARDGGDAMFNLHNDPPMSNAISESNDFFIEKTTCEIYGPAIMISCTDGCFGYLHSPMHFEALMIETLLNSDNMDEWKQNIESTLLPISGDDFSIAIETVGMSFEQWKVVLAKRYNTLMNRFIKPYDEYAEQIKSAPVEMSNIWEMYKTDYEAFAPANEQTDFKQE